MSISIGRGTIPCYRHTLSRVGQKGVCFLFFLPFPQLPHSMIGLTCGRVQLANQNKDSNTSGGCLKPFGLSLSYLLCFTIYFGNYVVGGLEGEG